MKKVHIVLSSRGIGIELLTQNLADKFNLSTISISEEIRKVLKIETQLSLELKTYIDKGEVIPDSIINKIIDNRIVSIQSNIQIVRYPRTKKQYDSLTDVLKSNGFVIEHVWFLKVQDIEQLISFRKENKNNNPHLIKFGFNEDVLRKNYLESIKQFNEIQESIFDDKLITVINFDYLIENSKKEIEKSIALYSKLPPNN